MVYTAIILGLFGSLHCIGMCGPIALALPLPDRSRQGMLIGRLLYNTGRILTYSLLGLLLGLFGQSISLAASQQTLSVLVGITVLFFFIIPTPFVQKFNLLRPLTGLANALKGQWANLLRQRSYTSLFLIGLLNGLLPCGLVYMAIAGAIAQGNSLQGMAFMALFGFGTLPVMLTTSLAAQWITPIFRQRVIKLAPTLTLVMAFLFILRGLNLGIPMLSPKVVMEKEKQAVKMACCHRK